jgi:hypothetical protein
MVQRCLTLAHSASAAADGPLAPWRRGRALSKRVEFASRASSLTRMPSRASCQRLDPLQFTFRSSDWTDPAAGPASDSASPARTPLPRPAEPQFRPLDANDRCPRQQPLRSGLQKTATTSAAAFRHPPKLGDQRRVVEDACVERNAEDSAGCSRRNIAASGIWAKPLAPEMVAIGGALDSMHSMSAACLVRDWWRVILRATRRPGLGQGNGLATCSSP